MPDDMREARGIRWGLFFATLFWIAVGAGFWSLMIEWGWVRR